MRFFNKGLVFISLAGLYSCSKGSSGYNPTPSPLAASTFNFNSLKVNGVYNVFTFINIK